MSENDKFKSDNWLQFIIHQLASNYGWSKSQINEVYPEEALVLLRMCVMDKEDSHLRDSLDKYNDYREFIKIQHTDKIQDLFKDYTKHIEILLKGIKVIGNNKTNVSDLDDELPQTGRMKELRSFVANNPRANGGK